MNAPAPIAPNSFEAGRLWSLWNLMQKLEPILSSGLFSTLARGEHKASIGPSFLKASPEYKENISLFVFMPAEALCGQAGLNETFDMLRRVKSKFSQKITYGEARVLLEQLRALMQSELSKCPLFLAKKDREQSFDNHQLFGRTVFDSFPSARMDIKEAGTCWVFGCNNAVIFHLISAAEFGLRALAEDRKVEIPNKKSTTPLEFAQWGQIIGELKKKMSEIDNWPRSQSRAEAQQFYNAALLSVDSFNSGWRIHIFHGRSKEYTDDETLALMGHVRRFMQSLSAKITETTFTEEVWS